MNKRRKWVLVYEPLQHGNIHRAHRHYLQPGDEDCPECDFDRGLCRKCAGSGLYGGVGIEIAEDRRISIHTSRNSKPCQYCNGTGRCRICDGNGVR